MPYLLDRLNQDHRHLARLLVLLKELLDRFHEGSEPDYELMCEMLEYMECYADQVHHPTEELIFQRMLGYGAEKKQVLDILTHQHALLSRMNKRFRQSLEGIVHEEVLLRQDVEHQGRELVDTLWEHLKLEEAEAFPYALERLSAADWEELTDAAPKFNDPVFGDYDPARFRTLFQHLMEQTQT
jgi:hemerythrin-like domain-containing protein